MRIISTVLITVIIFFLITQAQKRKSDDTDNTGSRRRKSLQIGKNLFCGEKNTIGRRCSRGGLCIRISNRTFRCQTERPAGKKPIPPSKILFSKNQIDCNATGVPPSCREPTILYIGGYSHSKKKKVDSGPAVTFPPCNNSNFDQLPADYENEDFYWKTGSAIMNGDIYSCGGLRGYITPALKDCQKNIEGHWEKAPSMITERAGFSMTTMGDGIIAAGGFNSRGIPLKTTGESGKSWNKFRRGMIPLDSVEIFDGKSWKNLTSKLPRPIGSHCAVSISETEILFIGGENIFSSRSNDIISSVIHFDVNDGFTGKQIPNMKYSRKNFGCAMFKGEVYVAGGDGTEGLDRKRKGRKKTAATTSEILNLRTLVWREGPSLGEQSSDTNLHVVNGQLMIDGDDSGEVWILDGVGRSWFHPARNNKRNSGDRSSSVAFTCK